MRNRSSGACRHVPVSEVRTPLHLRAGWSSDLHRLSDREGHQVIPNHQRTVVSLPRLRNEIVHGCRRDSVAGKEDEVRKRCKLRLGVREFGPGFARRCVMAHVALDVGL